MKTGKFVRLAWLSLGTFLLSSGGALLVPGVNAQSSAQQPDNTANNKQDSNNADQQKENAADRDLTKKIRHSIMQDKNLSTYAHNIKVIVRDGDVTLKGPVKSEDEKAAIEAKATEIAGPGKVQNQLTVKE
jgi:hyperosmotically inducible protein